MCFKSCWEETMACSRLLPRVLPVSIKGSMVARVPERQHQDAIRQAKSILKETPVKDKGLESRSRQEAPSAYDADHCKMREKRKND